MTIIVGTKSDRKIASIKKVLINIVLQENINIISYAAASNVSETPWDKETVTGAKNRALACKKHNAKADYYIGIESGLVERYGHIYEEAWTCVISQDNKKYFGYSSGLKVPDFILKKMKEHKLPHYLIFATLNGHSNKESNADTWAQYSGNLLLREISLEESLRNALVQIFSPKNSLYKKE